MILDPSILREIDEKVVLIESDTSSLDVSKLVRNSLEQDSLTHSDLLENGNTRVGRREKRRCLQETRSCLLSAWELALKDFDGKLSEDLILRVAKEINCGKDMMYRTETVRITGENAVFPPRAEKVRNQMEALLQTVNNTNYHAVERAAIEHLHYARIHPLIDGNGRSARLLQNLILNYEGYAPVMIDVGERTFYQELLRNAMRGYQDRESRTTFAELWAQPTKPSESELLFFNYIASKVSISLENQMSVVAKLPTYNIELKGHYDPGKLYAAKKVLQSYFKKHLGQVRLKRQGHDVIEVKGETSEEILGKVLVNAGYNNARISKK